MSQPAAAVTSRRPNERMSRLRAVLTYAVLAGWACICLFPFYWTGVTALKGDLAIVAGPFYIPFVDYKPSLEAWAYILFDSSDEPALRFLNSLIVGLTATLLTVLLGGSAVYGLTRFRHAYAWITVALTVAAASLVGGALLVTTVGLRTALLAGALLAGLAAFRGRSRSGRHLSSNGIFLAILFTRLLPPVAIVMPLYVMAQHTGTLDTRFALTATYVAANLPVAVWLLQPVLAGVPRELEDAAQLDGASHLRILFDIVLPSAARGVAATALLIFVLCWNEYLFSVYLAPDQAMTMPPFLAAQMTVREQQSASDAEDWAHLAAAILLMIGPPVLCAGLGQRFLAKTAWSSRP